MHILRPLKCQGKDVDAIFTPGAPMAGQFKIEKRQASPEKQGKRGQEFK